MKKLLLLLFAFTHGVSRRLQQGSAQKQDFVNNQALTKRTLIFTLFRKTQGTIFRKIKVTPLGKNVFS